MLRFGASTGNACEMDLDHIFISRLKLLIIMTRAYLEGYPLGAVRKRTLVGNARYIGAESIDLEQLIPIRNRQSIKDGMGFDHVFYQRVKLLAAMAKTIGKAYPMGEHRQKALRENLDMICSTLEFTSGIRKVDFLKVA
ncbi:hypothetical protein DSCA_58020 [Desulfosarcina alkanivorans]|jgi:hypothetical protein|uniref:Uncharacterized protein n=1 Tax=Desulfosarcina alkanivorans TaxID=571177 RepID=A0A5K7YQ35_9BACT|nr:hypothetical protein [Desulfosarcina alkanivorans]BBO71872.1 hypothetical protein DSCA_58020 [Desulfosarcina alkanivorans]